MTATSSSRRAVSGCRSSISFVNPFYYIDYALAQICAFQFFERSKKEPEQAWARLLPSLPGRRKQGIFCTAGAGRTEESVRGWNGGRTSLRELTPVFKTKSKVYDPSGARGRSEKGSRGGGCYASRRPRRQVMKTSWSGIKTCKNSFLCGGN